VLTASVVLTGPASASVAPPSRASSDGPSAGVDSLAIDDASPMRVALNAERADRVRKAAIAAMESLPDKMRDLERKILARPLVVAPTSGVVTQWYGSHPGVDIAPPYGTPVVAAHSGVVTFVGWQDGYGMHVEVAQADGIVTTYSHMSAFAVDLGQLVVAGQPVGAVGSTGWSTGPHLHFEVHLQNGERTDPALWLRWHGVSLTPEPGLEPEPLP
jgi:murein DD-endopeptidase MepM/ murein hydrolase activator NlpD